MKFDIVVFSLIKMLGFHEKLRTLIKTLYLILLGTVFLRQFPKLRLWTRLLLYG